MSNRDGHRLCLPIIVFMVQPQRTIPPHSLFSEPVVIKFYLHDQNGVHWTSALFDHFDESLFFRAEFVHANPHSEAEARWQSNDVLIHASDDEIRDRTLIFTPPAVPGPGTYKLKVSGYVNNRRSFDEPKLLRSALSDSFHVTLESNTRRRWHLPSHRHRT